MTPKLLFMSEKFLHSFYEVSDHFTSSIYVYILRMYIGKRIIYQAALLLVLAHAHAHAHAHARGLEYIHT